MSNTPEVSSDGSLFSAKRTFCSWWMECPPRMSERYFRMVVNEFGGLSEPNDTEADKKLLWKKACEKKQQIELAIRQGWMFDLEEVFGLELLVLRLMSDERLLAKAWNIRANYRELVSVETYRRYEESKPPVLDRATVQPEDMPKIRADAEDVLTGTHWWYTNSNYREKHIEYVKRNLAIALCVCVALVILLPACNKADPSPLLLLFAVCLMGVMGAILSIGRRILQVSSQNVTESDPVIKATQFDHGKIGIVLSICVGGTSALVLYFLMAAGLGQMGGELMPKFAPSCAPENCPPLALKDFFSELTPLGTNSYAKALCWSFVAGFAEKLVPDILDRMAKNDKVAK